VRRDPGTQEWSRGPRRGWINGTNDNGERVAPFELLALIAVFFVTSIVSVVTGSTSLITVPAMLQLGFEPRAAVATNMLALTLLSVGGSLAFRGKHVMDGRRAPCLIGLTLAGSSAGAALLLTIPSRAMPIIISVLMLAVAVFSVINRDAGLAPEERQTSRGAEIAGYATTFVLGVYGGFFSGGYVTLLTAAFVGLLGMTFVQAVSTTKLVNVFSSLIATLIFMWRGLVDYRLGLLLGIAMFVGALIGGYVTVRLSNLWLRRIFLTTVVALALKSLLSECLF
jgi:uncharacterized protein